MRKEFRETGGTLQNLEGANLLQLLSTRFLHKETCKIKNRTKYRQVTEARGWPEDGKDIALRNAILLGLKIRLVY